MKEKMPHAVFLPRGTSTPGATGRAATASRLQGIRSITSFSARSSSTKRPGSSVEVDAIVDFTGSQRPG
jgi:hypothetical protein